MKERKQLTFIQQKIIYSIVILLIYVLTRQVALPWVNSSQVRNEQSLVLMLTESLVGRVGTSNSVLTLGLGPMISASIAMQIIQSFLPQNYKQRAQMTLKKVMMVMTFIIALVRAIVQVNRMPMIATDPTGILLGKIFSTFALIGGMGFTIWLGSRNKKYGLGGTSLLILVNMVDTFRITVMPYFYNAATGQHSVIQNAILLSSILYCILLVFVIIVFQKAEVRIPVNRVMIHNVYADKNYMAISLSPAGSMPVMFALTVFSLPLYLSRIVEMFNPEMAARMHTYDSFFNLDFLRGVFVYMIIFAVLTVVFALVNVDPGQISDSFVKSGDTIPGVRAGKKTAHYLMRRLLLCCGISIIVLGAGVGLPLLAHIYLGIDQRIAMLPTTLMLLTGVVLTLMDEYTTLKTFEYYKPFL